MRYPEEEHGKGERGREGGREGGKGLDRGRERGRESEVSEGGRVEEGIKRYNIYIYIYLIDVNPVHMSRFYTLYP